MREKVCLCLSAMLLAAVVSVVVAVGWAVVGLLLDVRPPTATITAPPSAKSAAITTAGVLVAGRDMKPGDYQTFAPPGCTWAVLADVEPDADGGDVIASGQGPGPAAVRVYPGSALLTVGCGPWQALP